MILVFYELILRGLTNIWRTPKKMTEFIPSRVEALRKLSDFAPKAGSAYAKLRNYDHGIGAHRDVSELSPFIRRRSVTEAEVLNAVLTHHSLKSAEKFIQEVFWRTYWKGWLEMRPSVWTAYQNDLALLSNQIATQSGLRQRWENACLAKTGIDCFDAWAIELVNTGYLHNHARMWFASIWIFTLNLPWQLGADYFLRHLLDGDPASNTLSWRWVAGLQTVGKTYLARADNIEKFTAGRFRPVGLAKDAPALREKAQYTRQLPPAQKPFDPRAPSLFLLHEEDMQYHEIVKTFENAVGAARISRLHRLSPFEISENVMDFVEALTEDAVTRWQDQIGPVYLTNQAEDILDLAKSLSARQIVTPYGPCGPLHSFLRKLTKDAADSGIDVVPYLSEYDRKCWPHATHGFIKFKENIPDLLEHLSL